MKPLLPLPGAILVVGGLLAFLLSYSSITNGFPPGKGLFALGVGLALLLGLSLVSYSSLGERKADAAGSPSSGEEGWLSATAQSLLLRAYSSVRQ